MGIRVHRDDDFKAPPGALTALVYYASPEFRDSADHARAFLVRHGCVSWGFKVSDNTPPYLPGPPWPVDIAVWYAHGGWDGPVGLFSTPQISRRLHGDHWPALTAWFRRAVRPGGLFILHACHSGGSNRFEARDPAMATEQGMVWVRDIAEEAGVYAVGVGGTSAAANSYHATALLNFGLTGASAAQRADAYAPGGAKISQWRGWLTAAGPKGA